jgi:hypothetical protein
MRQRGAAPGSDHSPVHGRVPLGARLDPVGVVHQQRRQPEVHALPARGTSIGGGERADQQQADQVGQAATGQRPRPRLVAQRLPACAEEDDLDVRGASSSWPETSTSDLAAASSSTIRLLPARALATRVASAGGKPDLAARRAAA